MYAIQESDTDNPELLEAAAARALANDAVARSVIFEITVAHSVMSVIMFLRSFLQS